MLLGGAELGVVGVYRDYVPPCIYRQNPCDYRVSPVPPCREKPTEEDRNAVIKTATTGPARDFALLLDFRCRLQRGDENRMMLDEQLTLVLRRMLR